MLVLFMTPILIIFETANQLGFDPGYPGQKAAMVTIELYMPLTIWLLHFAFKLWGNIFGEKITLLYFMQLNLSLYVKFKIKFE